MSVGCGSVFLELCKFYVVIVTFSTRVAATRVAATRVAVVLLLLLEF